VARFGGIPLKRQKRAVIDDRVIAPINSRRRELVTRLQKRWCELCDKWAREVEVHQIPKIADLAKIKEPQPTWARIMAKRRRKRGWRETLRRPDWHVANGMKTG
jgi:hypothetical protein